MRATNLVQSGNILEVTLTGRNLSKVTRFPVEVYSPQYVICGCTVFQVRVIAHPTSIPMGPQAIAHTVLIKFVKYHQDDDLNYTIKLSSRKLEQNKLCFISDDGNWHLVNMLMSEITNLCVFHIAVEIDVVPSASPFSPLNEDTDFLDFELRGDDGSVLVHKLVLAAASPVFKTMLAGVWRETNEGRVDVPGTSKKTLQYFKNYMYLRTLPNEDIERLLLLSLCYMMPDLEMLCVNKLMFSLTAKTACDLLKFAGKYDATRLLLAILHCIKKNGIDIKEMRTHVLRKMPLASGDDKSAAE